MMASGRVQRYRQTAIGFVVVGLLLLQIGCVMIRPERWEPLPPEDVAGQVIDQGAFAEAELIKLPGSRGPECLAFDQRGRLYTGTKEGMLWRIDAPTGENPQPFKLGKLPNRPLGLVFVGDDLYVAVFREGIIKVTGLGGWLDGASKKNSQLRWRIVADEAGGQPILFPNGLTADQQGNMYITDSTSRFSRRDNNSMTVTAYDVLEAGANGRLIAFDPRSGKTRVVAEDLHFPNGVLVHPDGKHVLVSETSRYRVLSIPRDESVDEDAVSQADEPKVWIDQLPGFPDNLSADDQGNIWLGLAQARSGMLDDLHARPRLKRLLISLPAFLWKHPHAYGLVQQFDASGKARLSLHDADNKVHSISSAVVRDGWLFLGSPRMHEVVRIRLRDLPDPDSASEVAKQHETQEDEGTHIEEPADVRD